MKTQQVLTAFAGIALALLTAFFLSSTALLGALEENILNHILIIAVAAFLAVLGYEDWKDAQRERYDSEHRERPC